MSYSCFINSTVVELMQIVSKSNAESVLKMRQIGIIFRQVQRTRLF
jgi:hypothetical protein